VPGTTAYHAILLLTFSNVYRICSRHQATTPERRVIPVQTPLPHIPRHVAASVRTDTELSHWSRSSRVAKLTLARPHLRQVKLAPPGILPPIRAPRRLFPLRFRGQAHPGPLCIRHRVVPIDVYDGMVWLAPVGVELWSHRHLYTRLLAELLILF